MTEDEIDKVLEALDSVLRILERLENIKIRGSEWDWYIENDDQLDVASLRVIENIMDAKCEIRKHL